MSVIADLCHANYGVGDTYPNPKYDPEHAVENARAAHIDAILSTDPDAHRRAIRDTAPAMYFTCAANADGLAVYPCTGSAHRDGLHVVCSCECHRR